MCLQHVDVWGRNLSNESRGVLEAASHKWGMHRMICGVTLKDKVESTVIALRIGSGRFRGAFEVEKIEVVWTYCKKR